MQRGAAVAHCSAKESGMISNMSVLPLRRQTQRKVGEDFPETVWLQHEINGDEVKLDSSFSNASL